MMKRKNKTYSRVTRSHAKLGVNVCRMGKAQNGNVFFYILVGVILFAALAFTISRGMQGQTSTALNKRNIDLAVSDIMSQANEIENAVNNMRRNTVSENDICFENNLFSAINNEAYASLSTCSDDTYKLYHPSGGSLKYHNILEDWLDKDHETDQGYGEWMFTNVNGVEGIGTSTMSDAASMELLAIIPHLREEICEAINVKLGIGQVIPDNNGAFSPEPVDGGFTSTSGEISAAELEGKYSGCFTNNGSYIFYHVLIER